jgi:hypothetical protein
MRNTFIVVQCIILLFAFTNSRAQNPVITGQFSADPTARVFGDSVYLFPSHDIVAREGHGRIGWFCMEDYHVFSSPDLAKWKDGGIIVSQNRVKWVDSTAYSMWAPDCIFRKGKYYFYFPSISNYPDSSGKKRFAIGVAMADKPQGPYTPQADPIKGISGIDPNVFIDKDGQAYLYWAMGRIFAARLTDNMLELATDPVEVKDLPVKGLIEGPWMFERNGIYYMTYPHVQNNIERLEYATGDNPLGPFKFAGVIMDESPMNCWTNHQSFLEYKGQWYLFYHQNAFSPRFDKNRSVCIDSLFFNEDGSMRKVRPTLRGIGITPAPGKIEIDRFSAISDKGSSVEFLDTLNPFLGWKALLQVENSWIAYNAVDFGNTAYKSVLLRTCSQSGSLVQIRLDKLNGPLLSEIKLPGGAGWQEIEAPVSKVPAGIHNLVLVLAGQNPAEIDWIRFKK